MKTECKVKHRRAYATLVCHFHIQLHISDTTGFSDMCAVSSVLSTIPYASAYLHFLTDVRLVIYRISALFYTDKITMEPLTEHLCMLDLLDSQPARMYHNARVLQALGVGIGELHSLYSSVRLSLAH